MRKFLLPLTICFSLLLSSCTYFDISEPQPSEATPEEQAHPKLGDKYLTEISQDVKDVLEQKLQLLIQLSQDQTLIDYVTQNNLQNEKKLLSEIMQLDGKWSKNQPEVQGIIGEIISNELAVSLTKFGEIHPEFSEMFVSDSRSLVVASTNRTSSYYQGDKSWWPECFKEGKSFNSEYQYDDSAGAYGVSLYTPIIGPDKKAIGCLMGFIDITSLYHEITP